MTQRFALAGHPIDRSPSPAMHNAAFAELRIDATYSLRPATDVDAVHVVNEIQRGLWDGLNITTPLKTRVAPLVDTDAVAQRAGAVNTIWRSGTKLCGTITDVEGVRQPLCEAGFSEGGEALVIGSGGAARAAVLALEQLSTTVHVAARRHKTGEAVLAQVRPRECGAALALSDWAGLCDLFPRLTVIIQATPVGRDGTAHALPWERCSCDLVAFEMLYLPVQTPFLAHARQAGGAVVEGWKMLLAQGARALEIWTRQEAPRETMSAAIQRHIQDSQKSFSDS